MKRCILSLFIAILVIGTIAGCGTDGPIKTTASTSKDSLKAINPPANNTSVSEGKSESKPSVTRTSDKKNSFLKIHMIDADQGWALSQTNIMHTNDGGLHWSNVTPEGVSGQKFDLMDIGSAFLNGNTARFAVPDGKTEQIAIYSTEDEGSKWRTSQVTSQFSGIPRVRDLTFIDQKYGWLRVGVGVSMGTEPVELFRTMDGGDNWKRIAMEDNREEHALGHIPLDGDKSGMVFINHQTGLLTGFDHGDDLYLFQTNDGGVNWEAVDLSIPDGFTADGGSSTTMPPMFFDQKNGLLPVIFHQEGQPVIFYRTRDGGKTWQPTTAVHSMGRLSWSFNSIKHGIVTDGHKLYTTNDGGNSWSPEQPSIALNRLQQLNFVNSKDGWLIANHMLYRTIDGGETWK